MRKYLPVAFSLLLLLLTACQTATSEESATEEPKPTEEALPTIEPAEEPMAAVDYCLDCHVAKEQLISTAKLEEVVEEESKGVG